MNKFGFFDNFKNYQSLRDITIHGKRKDEEEEKQKEKDRERTEKIIFLKFCQKYHIFFFHKNSI